jgi:hypothetical protein
MLRTAVGTCICLGQQHGYLVEPDVFDVWQNELSGDLAKDQVIAITRHHRVQGSRGYSDSAEYVLNTLRGWGMSFEESWVESFRSDGKIHYQTWQSPSGWSIESGSLRMVSPSSELIVRFPEIAMSVMTYSNPGRVRAELVDVGSGTSDEDYFGKDIKGKLALATGYGGDVHRLAVLKYGAAAVICYLDDERAAHHPDMIQYTGIWPRSGEIPRVTFGFNISNRQGRKLKTLLAEGKRVVLDASVEGTGLEPWRMEVVGALFLGTEHPEQELILVAHLDHPKESANDNASGAAALMDIARTLKTLIAEGKLSPPRRTIRLLWVPEFFGTMADVDKHPELRGPRLGGKTLGCINLDMVGEDIDLLHSRMNITWTPPTMGSILPDVVSDMAAYLDKLEAQNPRIERSTFNYRVTPFSGGSDHVVFNDGGIQIPSVMVGHWPDYTHHTTEDTPDKVDPVELKRSELIAATSLWYLANLTPEKSPRVTNLVAAHAQSRLIEDTRKASSWLLEAPEGERVRVYHDAKEVIDFALEREKRAINNILDFAPSELTRKLVATWSQSLEGQAELQRRTLHAIYYQRTGRFPGPKIETHAEQEASEWIPTRFTRGPLSGGMPQLRLPEHDRDWYETAEAQSLDSYLLVNLIDGERSILEIRKQLTAATQPVLLEAVDRFVRDLAKVGLVELEKRP